MIRRRTYSNTVKRAQIARMHQCIDASMASLQPENVEPCCPICHGRFPEGEGIAEDRPAYASSWQPMGYCSEECKGLRSGWRP